MSKPFTKQLAEATAAAIIVALKGDSSGHSFHGNQWTGGIGGDGVQTDEARLPDPPVADHTNMTPPEKQDRALEMRNQGYTLNQIANHLGYAGTRGAQYAVSAATRRGGSTEPTEPPVAPVQPSPEPVTPEPTQPTVEPTPEQAAAGGGSMESLPPETIAQLQRDYQEALAQWAEIKAAYDPIYPTEQGAIMLAAVREMGDKVTQAVDAHFESVRPEAPRAGTEAEVDAARAKQADIVKESLDRNDKSAIDEFTTQLLAAQLAPLDAPYLAALREAGVPEDHPAYALAISNGGSAIDFRDGVLRGRATVDEGNASVHIMSDWVNGGYKVSYRTDPNGEAAIGKIQTGRTEITAMKTLGVQVDRSGRIERISSGYNIYRSLGPQMILDGIARTTEGYGRALGEKQVDAITQALGPDFARFKSEQQDLLNRYDEAKAEVAALKGDGDAYASQMGAAYRDLLFNTLGELRERAAPDSYPLGDVKASTPRGSGVSVVEGMQMTREAIATSTTRFPKEWVDATSAKFVNGIPIALKNGNGNGEFSYNNSGTFGKISVSKTAALPGQEAFGNTPFERTLQHEMTHSMQQSVPDIMKLERAFIDDRGNNGRDVRLPGYPGLSGQPDEFHDSYTGRNYGGSTGYREIITTGMEAMITPQKQGDVEITRTAREGFHGDTDFQNFMTGVWLLAGKG